MNVGAFRPRGAVRFALFVCFSVAVLRLSGAMAQTPSASQAQQTQSQPSTGSASATTTQSDDAAAKAVERKRKFDEQRKMMEGGYSPSKEESRRSDPDLMLSPSDVNLLVHDRVQFHLYDKGKEVGDGSWSAGPGTIVSSWFNKGVFTIEAKSSGTARVGVMIGSRATTVVVRVYPGTKMPKGVERSPEVLNPGGNN